MPARLGSGPKPKPTALRLLQGNPGKRPLAEHEPKPDVGLPPVPSWLSLPGKRKYRKLGAELLAARIVTRLDGDALARYASICARMWLAEDKLQRFGDVINVDGELKVSPYFSIVSRSHELLARLEAEFGLTPSSRTRIHVIPKARPDDPLAEYGL